jgi:hypothetical protein
LIIFYCALSKNNVIGSTNRRKIRSMAGSKPVNYCDIADFDGKLLGPEWLGAYPDENPQLVNFDISGYFHDPVPH